MGMRAEEEGTLPKKIQKNSMENKKREANASKEPGDCKAASRGGVYGSFTFIKEDKKKKKDKKNHEVSSSSQLGGIHEGAVNLEDCAGVDNTRRKEKDWKKKQHSNSYITQKGIRPNEATTALPGKIEKKSERKTKNGVNASGEAGGCRDDMPDRLESSLSKEGKKKKIDKKTHEVCNDVQHDKKFHAAVHSKDGVEVDNTCRKEEYHKKKNKKKKELEAAEELEESSMKNIDSLKGQNSSEKDDATEMKNGEQGSKKKKKRKSDNSSEKDDATEMKNGEQGCKKKKKRKSDKEDGEKLLEGSKQITDLKKAKKMREGYDGNMMDEVEKKRRKREKKQDSHTGSVSEETITMGERDEKTIVENKGFGDNGGNAHSTRDKALGRKTKSDNKKKRKKPDSAEINSEDHKSERKSKKVTFSDHTVVFPLSDDPKETNQEEDLVRGKRFSKEEDEVLKEAVYNYIEASCLGEEGLEMVLHCKSYPKVRNCWKEISAGLPHRTQQSIYYRAHILFERGDKHAWTPEELELVRLHHEKHGSNWKDLADDMGKHRFHVKDAWRRIKLLNKKKGHWSQEEYQKLFDLVNLDLQMKVFEEKQSKHGMLRDNIAWTAISDKLSTRSDALCCMKWYRQLTSPMVAEKKWADVDDYLLLIALFSLDACCIEDVDWDNLIDHRSGDVCRKRWNQMVLHLGQHGNKSFAEQVEVLSKRYCPNLLEAREIWDSKPIVR